MRGAVGDALGSPVARGARVWGGYSPSPTFRLRLHDGRRAFFKGCDPGASDTMRAAFFRELRVYDELADRVRAVAPAVYAVIERDGWHALLLEDLGPKSVPPWRPAAARGIIQAYGKWHRQGTGEPLPSWVPRPGEWLDRGGLPWTWTNDRTEIARRAAVAGPAAQEAGEWLRAAGEVLAACAGALLDPEAPTALLHGDVRSDNLRWTAGRLVLFDWPWARAGAVEHDLAMFAQSVTAEGGPDPEQLASWYCEIAPVDAVLLDAGVSAVGNFFADQAWREDIPGLPRLRSFQRRQLVVTLRWAARRLGLPSPAWLDAVATGAGST